MQLTKPNGCSSSHSANDYEHGHADPCPVPLASLEHWLVTRLATDVGLAFQEIDTRQPCTAYGLDSITGVAIVGDLELWLDIRLSPTLLWDCPSIASISQHVMMTIRHNPKAQAQDEVEPLVAALDALSDAEVDVMLNHLLAA